MSEKPDKNHFRITIFGSARIKKDDQIYKNVFNLAEKIGEKGYDIITGGGPGLMKAANSGHQKGKKNNGAHSFGLTITNPTIPNNPIRINTASQISLTKIIPSTGSTIRIRITNKDK